MEAENLNEAKTPALQQGAVSGQLPERWQPCGEGENICNCKNASECGYIEFYAGIASLDGEGNFR